MEAVQLPRGRHRLTREEVVTSQRDRMLVATADVVAELGYAKTTVAEVIRRAGVSRETFYEQFANKEEAFLAAYDGAASLLGMEMGDELNRPGALTDAPLEEKLARILSRYLSTLAGEPAIAKTFLCEVYAAGPEALQRRVDVQHGFVALVAHVAGATDERQRFACEALVASVTQLVTQRVAAGKAAELESLVEPLRDLASILLDGVGLS